MTDDLLNRYSEFVKGVTSPASRNNMDLIRRIEELNSQGVNVARLLTAGIGIPDEGGEIAGLVKKIVFHGKPLTQENKELLEKELGDVLWYWMQTCLALHIDPNDVIIKNIKKLESRYPGGKFSIERSEVRAEGDT